MSFQLLLYGKLLAQFLGIATQKKILTFLISVIFISNTPIALLSGKGTVPFHLVLTIVPTVRFQYSAVESAFGVGDLIKVLTSQTGFMTLESQFLHLQSEESNYLL